MLDGNWLAALPAMLPGTTACLAPRVVTRLVITAQRAVASNTPIASTDEGAYRSGPDRQIYNRDADWLDEQR